MWDLNKVELGNQQKAPKNVELRVNRKTIQDPKVVANIFNE
jgi:hypothetical protein